MTTAVIDKADPELGGGPPVSSGPEPTDRSRRPGVLGAVTDRVFRRRPTSEWVTFALVAGAVAFVFWNLGPQYLLKNSTPTGGDMSAHVWGPAYLRDHLLTKGRISGWSPDWYAGFPAFHFYMVIPALAIALLSYVIPYGIAFKLVAVSGAVSLPFSAYLFGRMNRLPAPAPAFMSIGAVLFLFDRFFSITGGNIASMLAGEFAYSISLSLGLLYLAVLSGSMRTGRHRGLAAVLFALCLLCHVIPAICFGLASLVWLAVRPGRNSLKAVFVVAPLGGLLAFWWYGPFGLRSGYLNDMGWSKTTDYITFLYHRTSTDGSLTNYPNFVVLFWLAIVGLGLCIWLRHRVGVFMAASAAAVALVFRFQPDGIRLWNARLLPFYYLMVDMLAMVALALAIREISRWFAARDRELERGMVATGVFFVVAFCFQYVAMPMQNMPFFGKTGTDNSYSWQFGPIKMATRDASFVKSWAKWNFDGLEAFEMKARTDENGATRSVPTYDRSYPEFVGLINTLKNVAKEHGCGRAMWEYEEDHNRFGSTMEPMMLPHFTDGCIGSMEGLYFEASATTPYHFINSTQLSTKGSGAQRELPYPVMPPNSADFDQGIGHLRMLGVKYYLAIDNLMKKYAAANKDLTPVADTGPWRIYTVAGSELVAPMPYAPVVLTGQHTTGPEWLDTTACWYVNEAAWDVPLVADGPTEWPRATRTNVPAKTLSAQEKCSSPDGSAWGWFSDTAPPKRALEPVKVSGISEGDDGISFDVDKPGVPVLVKMSYFPNFKATGAGDIYRASPNMMVVVPTGNHVEIRYGYTGVDLFSYFVSLIGLGLVVLLVRYGPMKIHDPRRFWAVTERPDLVAAVAVTPSPTTEGVEYEAPAADRPPPGAVVPATASAHELPLPPAPGGDPAGPEGTTGPTTPYGVAGRTDGGAPGDGGQPESDDKGEDPAATPEAPDDDPAGDVGE